MDVKLWMPTKMNADLQRIADNAQIPLSQVLREILISALFGHGYLADRAQWDFSGRGKSSADPDASFDLEK